VDATLAAQTIGPALNRSGHFDPITGGHLDWLWARLNQSRAPATVCSDQRLGAERTTDTPVMPGKELDEAPPPGVQGCFRQLGWRVVPIDLLDHQKVSGIDVQALGPRKYGRSPLSMYV
jgi:hypothetical protein